jgi:hypothetical protein
MTVAALLVVLPTAVAVLAAWWQIDTAGDPWPRQ